MNPKKWRLIGASVLALGSLSIAFSYTPQNGVDEILPQKKLTAKRNLVSQNPVTVSAPSSQIPIQDQAPLANLTPSPSQISPSFMENYQLKKTMESPSFTETGIQKGTSVTTKKVIRKTRETLSTTKIKAQEVMAKTEKPKNLFSYVRLLNFSPHPQQEEFLQKTPLVFNGKQYHISVSYLEGWEVTRDEEGNLKKLGFEIKIYENGKMVRTLRTPDVAINPTTIKPGQILGLAKVEPYNFRISVDSFALKQKGVSELVFKFEMLGNS